MRAYVGTSFCPLPCQAWHGMRFTSAQCMEVEVGADRPASAPHAGRRGFAAGGRRGTELVPQKRVVWTEILIQNKEIRHRYR
jgi:hypothetical protein